MALLQVGLFFTSSSGVMIVLMIRHTVVFVFYCIFARSKASIDTTWSTVNGELTPYRGDSLSVVAADVVDGIVTDFGKSRLGLCEVVLAIVEVAEIFDALAQFGRYFGTAVHRLAMDIHRVSELVQDLDLLIAALLDVADSIGLQFNFLIRVGHRLRILPLLTAAV